MAGNFPRKGLSKSSVTGKGDKRAPFTPRKQPTTTMSGPAKPSPKVSLPPFTPRPQPEPANPPAPPDMRTALTGVAGKASKPMRAPKPPAAGKGMRARR